MRHDAESESTIGANERHAWRGWWDNRGVRADVLAAGAYVLTAVYVFGHLWANPNTRLLAGSRNDHAQFQYFAQFAARVVIHGEFPFQNMRMNVPDGVNFMANTPVLGLTVPLAPITLLFGAGATFVLMGTLGLASTAAAWYWLFSRHIVSSRLAAFVGGAFAGFAPGMVSQANGHPNLVNLALVPVLIYCGLRLRETERWRRNAVVLALLAVWQAFISEEILLFTAVGAGIFVAAWSLHHRAEARAAARTFARGLGLAAGIAAVLLAFPLYWQFAGPQAYHGLAPGFQVFGTDIAAVTSFAGESLLGNRDVASSVALSPSEENSFFGWPLVVFIVVLGVLFRRHVIARCAMIAAGVFFVLSFGSEFQLRRHPTGIPGPYYPFKDLPILDSVIASRLVLFSVPVVGLLMALWVERARGFAFPVRATALGVVAVALVGTAPTPLATVPRVSTPAFVTSGDWRTYVPEGRSMMTVPVTAHSTAMEGMQWSADVGLDLMIVGGYFHAPDTTVPERYSAYGLAPRPTSDLLARVAATGELPRVTASMQADARDDLRHWRVAVVVLDPRTQPAHETLRELTTELLGFAPVFQGDLWVWDVRSLVE